MSTSTTGAATTYVPAMRRAIELSAGGPVWGENPQVGCVLLDDAGTVLAEGWHRGAGTAHAEVDALSQLPQGGARGATAVVTLEPCNHTGRTGPCARALLEAGVARVVYAIADPGDRSSGGARTLAEGGVEVIGGVCADEVAESIHGWLTAARLRRPFVTVKWAASLDGRAAAGDGTSQWITGPEARDDVHERRARAGAILVGTGTLLDDDPSLTARRADGTLLDHQPTPVIVGTRPIPAGAAVHTHPEPPLAYPTHDVRTVLADLYDRGFRSAFVEGGPTLASAFLRAGLADEVLVYQAPLLLGGPRLAVQDVGVATLNDAIRLEIRSVHRLGDDVLTISRPKGR
ncbi:bifunctional diaminohydroxyphosphoribosylaminopyrimidine deaminase/5-amino-6-(5-phosphoribosylamino)uracil reductase RibD [Planctomonas deserti]|uniref:bifunctional diaminohydroxyphosphoribosylaminopyrimidine deaminase/5-amino-6-(5-phosphoribosylamino)uracil reductase RibD n=1 Tax=Planctomonas deserti TaxID=2144185 RepID=UPI001F0BBBE9|nr:bifunctional diaminohydroxyphosphoribosylaminopyrimidine deaminase/5-amino-6-(5-phosphoribosylamino)uracil reductase RibD [Planctomonas deserti]